MRSSVWVLVLLGVAGCSRESKPVAAALDVQPVVLTQGPLTYFQSHCARCHGAYGSFYADSLGKLTVDALTSKIDEMARGPGAAPLQAPDLMAQVALHRSMPEGLFVSIVTSGAGQIAGEVTLGATVELKGDFGVRAAEVNGHVWRLGIQSGQGYVVEARMGGRVVILNPMTGSFGSQ